MKKKCVIRFANQVKQGEMKAIVTATGKDTFFGRTAQLAQASGQIGGHLQVVLAVIGWFCISYVALMVALELIVQFVVYGTPCTGKKTKLFK